jgi:glycosyltransferase involved in cell wall biosynthesis
LTIATQYVKIVEKLAVKLSDFILCVSTNDKLAFINNYNIYINKIKIIPNGTDFQNICISARNKKKYGLNESKVIIIFHGSYEYPPNFEAIELIKNKISMEVKKYTTNAEFVIAGAKVPISYKHPSVKFLGFVEDLYSLLKSSDIAIVPIINGGGTKLKILDYLGSGLPIVTTRKGIDGINAKNGEHAIIVDEVDDKFVDAIKYLISNENERKRIGANACKLAEEEYDWRNIGKKLDGLYRNILMEFSYANK